MDNSDLLFFCTLCKEKSPEEIAQIKCTIPHSIKKFKKGEYIAYQGDEIASLYMLTKGKVKTGIVSDPGLTLQIEELKAPYPLAAAFLFAKNNHFPVDVIALEESEIILITKDSLEKQMAKCPHFLRGFMAFSADRIQFLSERLKIFSLKGIKAKVAFYILQRTKNNHFELGKSITSLAEYFGVERPSLSRAISEMVHDGLIEFEGGKGKIINLKAIKEML
jgi:CRP-like cAMP-binding protein